MHSFYTQNTHVPGWFLPEPHRYSKAPGAHLTRKHQPQNTKNVFDIFNSVLLISMSNDDGSYFENSAVSTCATSKNAQKLFGSNTPKPIIGNDMVDMERNLHFLWSDNAESSKKASPGCIYEKVPDIIPSSPSEGSTIQLPAAPKGSIAITCKYWAAGKCARKDCPFMHEHGMEAPEPLTQKKAKKPKKAKQPKKKQLQ